MFAFISISGFAILDFSKPVGVRDFAFRFLTRKEVICLFEIGMCERRTQEAVK